MKKPDKKARLQLIGLGVIAERHHRALKEVEEAVAELLDLKADPHGRVADFVYGSTGLDETLDGIARDEKADAERAKARK